MRYVKYILLAIAFGFAFSGMSGIACCFIFASMAFVTLTGK